MRDVQVKAKSVEFDCRVEQSAWLAAPGQRLDPRVDHASPRENGIAVLAFALPQAGPEHQRHPGQALQLRGLIGETRLPSIAVDFLQSGDIGMRLSNHGSDPLDVRASGQRSLPFNVVAHDAHLSPLTVDSCRAS